MSNKLYRIDWDKYLSPLRENKSSRDYDGIGPDKRNPFESDLGRVVFCPAIRRMHDKTQVVPLTSGDCVLTRLTHSIIVMNIAESLCLNYCRDNDFKEIYGDKWFDYYTSIYAIVRAASLVHDIGNPPFGHFGEIAIQQYFHRYLNNFTISEDEALDFLSFDGNAQGLRILSKLQYVGRLDGINLTYSTLGAYMKYPNDGKENKKYIGSKKHGVFVTERDLFYHIVDKCNLRIGNKVIRHPLSFLVEAADSIGYNVMDVEDGFNLGWYSYEKIVSFLNIYITENVKNIDKEYMSKNNTFDVERFLKVRTEINGVQVSDKYKMMDLRVKLIGYLVELANIRFKENLEDIDKGEYSNELIEDQDPYLMVDALKEFSKRYIISKREVTQVEMSGDSVITGLLDILLSYAFNRDKKHRDKLKGVISDSRLKVTKHEFDGDQGYKFFTEEDLFKFDLGDLSPYSKMRLIVDFVSSMTDKFAVEMYQKLSGHVL